MASITLTINGTPHTVDVDPSTPLLWVLRDHLGLTGTKFGCKAGIGSSSAFRLASASSVSRSG